MNESAISVNGLRKVFKGRDGEVVAVDGLDLDVRPGECFGLLGPNGAGKTTTVEIMEGLQPPTAGEVRVLGRLWRDDAEAIRQRIGVTLQETKFPEKSTVREMVDLFGSFYRAPADLSKVLARVELESKANAFIETLSGGQQRRLAVALALVGDPELLFLDEPTTGLDPQSRRQLWEVIRELQGRGRTTLLTTHYMDEAERLCDRVAVVDHGKIIALGPPRELIARLGGEHIVEFALAGQGERAGDRINASEFSNIDGVLSARDEGDGYALNVDEPHRVIPALLDSVEEFGRPLARLTTRQVSLEDVFVNLTGRHLRDGDDAAEAAPKGRKRGRRRAG